MSSDKEYPWPNLSKLTNDILGERSRTDKVPPKDIQLRGQSYDSMYIDEMHINTYKQITGYTSDLSKPEWNKIQSFPTESSPGEDKRARDLVQQRIKHYEKQLLFIIKNS